MKSSDFLTCNTFSNEEVTKAIIGTMSDIDAPETPSSQGYRDMVRFLNGTSNSHIRQRRQEVLSTTADHFRTFGEHLGQMHQSDACRVVVVGGAASCQGVLAESGWKRRDVL